MRRGPRRYSHALYPEELERLLSLWQSQKSVFETSEAARIEALQNTLEQQKISPGVGCFERRFDNWLKLWRASRMDRFFLFSIHHPA
jgi:hypothetical protein